MAAAPSPPPRWLFAVAFGATVLVFGVGWVVLGVLSALACDGDGGVPYAAHASPVGELCDARGDGWLLAPYVAGLLVAPAGLLVLGVAAIVRRDWRLLVGGTAAAFVLLLGVTLPFLVLPSNCSDEQRATLARADCETY